MLEPALWRHLLWQNKQVIGLVECIWPCHLSFGLFVLPTKRNVRKGPALLQTCYECLKAQQDTIWQDTRQVWVGTVNLAVTSSCDTPIKVLGGAVRQEASEPAGLRAAGPGPHPSGVRRRNGGRCRTTTCRTSKKP